MEEPSDDVEHSADREQETRQTDQESRSPKSYPLASRMRRFFAYILDQLIIGFALVPFSGYLGMPKSIEAYATLPENFFIRLFISFFIAFMLINGLLLYRYGQTVGKRLMNIAVATMDYNVPEFNRLIAFRYLPFLITAAFPSLVFLFILNVIFIFRDDKRCVHDLLANTQVIHVGRVGK